MKNLFLVLGSLVALSSTALANQIVVDGLQAQYRTTTVSEVTHTEYRNEDHVETCSREVFDGYRQECNYVGGEQQCTTVGGGQECGLTPAGRECHDVPGHEQCYTTPGHQECHNEPSYRTEYYSCTRTISVPYTVKDYDINNDVIVNVARNQQLPAGVHEVLNLAQSGQTLTITSAQSTAKVLVFATQQQSDLSSSAGLRRIQTVVTLQLIDRTVALGAFLSPLGEITADVNGMKITTGLILDPASVRFDLTLSRKKFLGKDESLLQKTFSAADVTLTNAGNQTVVSFDFQKLQISSLIAGKKTHIELRVQSNVNLDTLVNRQDIPAGIGEKKEITQKM